MREDEDHLDLSQPVSEDYGPDVTNDGVSATVQVEDEDGLDSVVNGLRLDDSEETPGTKKYVYRHFQTCLSCLGVRRHDGVIRSADRILRGLTP